MLNEILEKLGLKSIDQLTSEERKTYLSWGAVLSKPETTIEDIKEFLPKEIERLRTALNDYENSKEKDLYFKACLRNAELITNIISTPEKERAQLRTQLEQRFGAKP